jgi:hypothetical protein
VDTFDEYKGLFLTIGLSEEAATVAAVGRNRNEVAAREIYRADEAEALADRLRAEAAGRPSVRSQELAQLREGIAQLYAAVPDITANVMRALQGKPMVPARTHVQAALAPSAEAIVGQVRESLRMTDNDARAFAARLYEREVRRGGAEHAARFMTSFGEGLRPTGSVPVREVASW